MDYEILIKPKVTGERDWFYEPRYIFDYLILQIKEVFISFYNFNKYEKQQTERHFGIGESC